MPSDNIQSDHTQLEGGVTAPAGFVAAGVAAGIKRAGKLDVALLAADKPVPAAAVFTRSSTAAAPVHLSRKHVASGYIQAAVTNAGNANACTGETGYKDAESMAELVAARLCCDPTDVIVASTGVIGVPMPMDVVLAGIDAAADALDTSAGPQAAEAIMTTDTFAKELAVQFEADGHIYRIGGMAKGSGMIEPNMATMLGYLTTDAALIPAACHAALAEAVRTTFNRITVDGDTSTNDMVLLMASGAADGPAIDQDHPAFAPLVDALTEVCAGLAHMIVRDGEGATRFITITVRGALDEADAEKAARSIANSPLFKTAVFGGDANWGRVAMALGKSGARLEADRIEIVFAGITTCLDGTAVEFSETEAAEALSQPEIDILVDLHMGEAQATVWTCDLSYEYVRINGEYRS